MKALQLTGLMILIILINSSMIYSQDYLLYSSRKFAANVIVPQTRSFDIEKRGKVNIEGISVKVNIVDQVATTEIEISLNNPTRIRLEAEVILPVPESATVRGFDFQGKGLESSAVIMKKEDARKIYNGIVSKMKDPAILEFAGLSLIRSCVFPVESGSTQRVKLVYEELLLIDNNRVDYVLPRSESLSYSIPWEYKVTIKSKKKISTVYSPSHHIETSKSVDDTIAVNISKEAENNPGPLRISYLYKKNSVSASLITYPDSSIGGGYFLFLASPSSKPSDSEKILKRELTIVIDRSGSMRGKKIQQVTEVALQMISGLDNGEVFNVIVYNEGVDFFSDVAVEKNNSSVINVEKYLENIQPRGGTNIHEALVIALGKKPVGNYLPIVLFLTDGLPTIGQTSEKEIRKTVMKENPYNRRVFTIGVGVDVNTPLLDKIALETRGKAAYVLPKEDIEVKIASVFKKLTAPVFASPDLQVLDTGGKPVPNRVEDVIPGKIPDIFVGDQLVILGKYKGNKQLIFKISGNYLGTERTFQFTFDMDKASTRNSYVPRIWASREIAILIDGIRQFGGSGGGIKPEVNMSDPKVKELVDEIVYLSIKFGILTEYTAFLAKDGTDLVDGEKIESLVGEKLKNRAIESRSGVGALNQSYNFRKLKEQKTLNFRNSFYDSNMSKVKITTVQQINDMAFYNRSGRWIDSRLEYKKKILKPGDIVKTIIFGTEEYNNLVKQLIKDNRQGVLSLSGEVLLEVSGKIVLLKTIR